MKRTHLICIVILAVTLSIIFFAVKSMNNKKQRIEIRCSGELISRRKNNDAAASELHTTIFLFLYDNGKGVLTQKGELSTGGNQYLIDREMWLTYSDSDNDGVYKFDIFSGKSRTNDNLPESVRTSYPLLGNNPTSYYMNITSIDNELYLFNELSAPLFICKRF